MCGGVALGIARVCSLLNSSEAVLWREKESSWIKAVQIDNLRGLLGSRRMNLRGKTGVI